MDVDGRASRRSSTSSSEARPTLKVVHKAVQLLREDLDKAVDAQKAAQKQLLFTMAGQVRRDRAEASCQLVIQGFEPWTESGNPVESFGLRDKWCREMVARMSGVPTDLVKMSCSHGTAADKLSRLSIITLQSSSLAGAVARAVGTKKLPFNGTTMVTVKRQTCAYDRLVSAPIKIAMECISQRFNEMKNAFRPSWKDGTLWSKDGALIGLWRVDVQQAKIRVHLQEAYIPCVREGMDRGIARLQFGTYDEDSPSHAGEPKGKGKAKGKGRGKVPARDLHPVEKGCFKHAPPEARTCLGSLVMTEYPFTIHIRSLKEEHYIETGAAPPSREPKKRSPEGGDEYARAKWTPTPERRGRDQNYAPAVGPVPDPWAMAQQRGATATPSSGSTMPPLPSQSELAFGSRISA